MPWKFWRSWTGREWTEFILASLIGLFTIVNAVSMVIYVGIFNKSVYETGKQTDKLICAANIQAEAAQRMADAASAQADRMAELARQATEQAFSTNLLAQQTKRYADIAEQVWRTNRELSREDRRAWLSAEVGSNEGKFFIAMHNTGKTPALKGTYVIAVAPGTFGVIPKVDLSRNSSSPMDMTHLSPEIIEQMKKEGLLPEHPEIPRAGYIVAPGKSEKVSAYLREFDKVFMPLQDLKLYIQGRFTYEDIFGGKHETRFCYWFAAADDFPMCTDNNYMN